jgi:hypothetical protein
MAALQAAAPRLLFFSPRKLAALLVRAAMLYLISDNKKPLTLKLADVC